MITNTNKATAYAEMTREMQENCEAMEKNQGYEFVGVKGYYAYMASEDQMKTVKIDHKGRAYAA